ncbi:MAG TPA: hypothetical protein P5562_00195, partial [Candidatus Woesebacteria bacterium]|nr:hypothetical protein [Candidatus Woesebacteria bacterium]
MKIIEAVIPLTGLISIVVAFYLYKWLDKQIGKNDKSNEFSKDIQLGSVAYLKRLFQALISLAGVVAIIVYFGLGW